MLEACALDGGRGSGNTRICDPVHRVGYSSSRLPQSAPPVDVGLGSPPRAFFCAQHHRPKERRMTVLAEKILVVEDDPITRADVRAILEDAGFDACPDARDGMQAIELARTHRPDLV